MNFVMVDSLFAQAPSLDLLRLIGAAVDQRHRVQVESTGAAWVSWHSRLEKDTADSVDVAVDWSTKENALRPAGLEVRVESDRSTSAWSILRLTLADAIDLAFRPFRILLENAESDGRFLRAMLTSEERGWFDQMVEREWLLLQTCGGITELEKCVTWATADRSRLVRCAALFDGDAVEAPTTNPESHAGFELRLHKHSRDALRRCQQAQAGDTSSFPHHVLRRRSIESYIPFPALERWANRAGGKEQRRRQKLVSAFGKIAHRNYYHLKEGYAKDRRRAPPPSWLPKDTSSILEGGFGTAISHCFDAATLEELKADGGFAELRPFVNALRSWVS